MEFTIACCRCSTTIQRSPRHHKPQPKSSMVGSGIAAKSHLINSSTPYLVDDVKLSSFTQDMTSCDRSTIHNSTVSNASVTDTSCQKRCACQLAQSPTQYFENMFFQGDEAAELMQKVSLEPQHWEHEVQRIRAENDLFVLFLAKFLESGLDFGGRAVKGIAYMLLSDTDRLSVHIDEVVFHALLNGFNDWLPANVQEQISLVVRAFTQLHEHDAKSYFDSFNKDLGRNRKAGGFGTPLAVAT